MEEVTKVIEDVDKLFSEIVVNGEAHVSERYVPPAPTPSQSLPQNQNDSQEDSNEDEPAQAVEGEYVDTLNLNGVDHDFRDTPLTALVTQLQQLLSTLQTRLNSLVSDIGAINSKIPAEASTANKLADKNYVGNLISAINALIPTEASTTNKLADKDYVGNSISAITALIPSEASTTNKLADKDYVGNLISAINALIPAQASSSNQLADKDFVNSSIGTNTANYISDNGNPFTSVSALEAYSGTVTNNDYAFVTGTDSAGNIYYDRYKATVSGSTVTWAKEYRLNNSSFTAEQWATINSGISQVSSSVQSGDDNPVSSDAVYQALQNIVITAVDVVQNGNMNAVTSNAVYQALQNIVITAVDVVQNGNMNAVTSNAVYNFVPPVATTAHRVRTSTPSSLTDGDIWVV